MIRTSPWIVRVIAAMALFAAAPATAQDAAEKPRVAVRSIDATDGVVRAARANGQAEALQQILEAADGQLIRALSDSRRFDVVARSDLAEVLKEQGLADSGLVDPSDPQTARAYALAGARYVVTVRVDNFQDAVAKADFDGGLGRTTIERRTVQLLGTLRIYDTTTGVLLETVGLRLEESDVRETLPGARHEGRLTNALLGSVAETLARRAANAVLDRLAPARVLAYTFGQVTLNRAEGTGIEPGQYWRVYHAGRELVDPETGEVLGAEEVPVGWVRITEVTPRFSKAQAIEDDGIDVGAVLRLAPDGLPPGVDPNGRVRNSAGSAAPARERGPGVANEAPSRAPEIADADPEPAGTTRLAIFVRLADPDLRPEHADAIESWVTAGLAGPGIEVISRSVVLSAVAALGSTPGEADDASARAARLLDDQASAAALARTLGADGILIATAADLSESRRQFADPDLGVESDLTETELSMTWTLISGATGGAVASGHAEAAAKERLSATSRQSRPDLGPLLRDAGMRLGRSARASALAEAGRTRAPAEGEVRVTVRVSMEELSVPEIRKIDGAWVVTGASLPLTPSATDVLVDGFLVGTAPGEITLTPGPHRLRLEGPGLEPADRFVVAREGMTLTVPVRLSEEGRARWMQHAAFLEGLKDGAALRENEQALAHGLAQFLRSSRLTIDTSALRSLTVSPETHFWADLIRR